MTTLEARVARALDLDLRRVSACLALLDEGATVPFIARYRKDRTGDLDEVQIRDIAQHSERLRALEARRDSVLASLAEQGVRDAALLAAIADAPDMTTLEDLYAPHRPRRRTRAMKAQEAGLGPVADAILADSPDAEALARRLLSAEFPELDAALAGARDILAERLADNAHAREHVRQQTRRAGTLVSKKKRGAEPDPRFAQYLEFSAPVQRLKPHQVLAVRRGAAEGALSHALAPDSARVLDWMKREFLSARRPFNRRQQELAIEDSAQRLLQPGAERDVWAELAERADQHAISVFALNLRQLLMQPPMPGQTILGVDPGMRTGCKLAVVGPHGEVIETGAMFVHDGRRERAGELLRQWIARHGVRLIAIGNGTGSRETEEVVAQALRGLKDAPQFAIVDEAGASVYSASTLAREELPGLDVTLRGAVSIARRLQDPLAELIKIDPRSVGVGMYQHDVDPNALTRAVDATVEDVVHAVGVDLNTASAALLTHLSGIGPALAARIVAHRQQIGGFKRRDALREVKGVGARTFELCSGFVRVREGEESLDNTGIHPEHYPFARALLRLLGHTRPGPELTSAVAAQRPQIEALAAKHDIGAFTLRDLLDELTRPGRDPRRELAAPMLRADVLSLDDLHEGMRVRGTVRNVVDFGAFVDLGVKQDGLIHVSELSDKFIQSPHEVVAVGDQVEVTILTVDAKRQRIALSLKR